MLLLLIVLVWLVVTLPVGIVLGRAVSTADRRQVAAALPRQRRLTSRA